MFKKVAIAIALSLVFALGNMSAFAQPAYFDMEALKEIQSYDYELSYNDYLENSDLYENVPNSDSYLAYRIRLPRGWVNAKSDIGRKRESDSRRSSGISSHIVGEVERFYGPGRVEQPLSRFNIYAQTLDHEVTAKNWFMHEIIARGYTLEGFKEHSDRRVEALYVYVDGDISYKIRSLAEINGPRMVVISYAVPENFWDKERGQQQRALETFEFLNPSVSRIERLREHKFADLLSFKYPMSWVIEAPLIETVDGMEAKLRSAPDERSLYGEIQISVLTSAYGEDVVSEEIAYQQEEMSGYGFEFGDRIDVQTGYDLPDHVFYGHVESYDLVEEGKNYIAYEYWFAVMEEERYFYVLGMFTPSRKGDYYTWARNKEAFRTVIENFKP